MRPRIDQQYIEISKRLQQHSNIGATAIAVLIIASVASDTRTLVIAIGFHAFIVPLNVLVAHTLVPRYGPRIEVPRTIVNMVATSLAYHAIGWPVAVWLWLPFGAIAFDQSGGRYTHVVLILMCVMQGTAGLIDGVDPIYPIAFTAFAVMCWSSTRARARIIGAMLERAECQRDELATAHDELRRQTADHQRLQVELRQAQKLESVGRLAAGVAHEINTPIQFVSDSVQFLRDCDRRPASRSSICHRADQPSSARRHRAIRESATMRDRQPSEDARPRLPPRARAEGVRPRARRARARRRRSYAR